MIKLTRDRSGDVRNWACFALGTQTTADGEAIRAALVDRVNDRHRECRAEAVLGLGRRRDDRAVAHVLRALKDEAIGRLTVEAAAYVGSDVLLSELSSLEGKWDRDSQPDSKLLRTAISQCDPTERARHIRLRGAARGRFEDLLRANLAQRYPALKLIKVALAGGVGGLLPAEPSSDDLGTDGEPQVTNWY